jgi:hypothetical protein
LTRPLPWALALAASLVAAVVAPAGAAPTCTQVIGFSQTLQWYQEGGVFESVVDDARWQLLGRGGASIDQWQNPDYEGWSDPLYSPCANGSAAPDRVVLTVSGIYGADEDAWVAAIAPVVTVIETKYPSAAEILLQPVVGGPGHADCFFQGELVRASWQHAHIDAAIARLVAGHVAAGASPEVGSCDHYIDQVGHLTDAGGRAAGASIGAFYAAFDGSTTTTSVPATTTSTSTSTTLPPECATPGLPCSLATARALLGALECTSRCRCPRIAAKLDRVAAAVGKAEAAARRGSCRRWAGTAAAAARKVERKAGRARDRACAAPAATAEALATASETLALDASTLDDGPFCERP